MFVEGRGYTEWTIDEGKKVPAKAIWPFAEYRFLLTRVFLSYFVNVFVQLFVFSFLYLSCKRISYNITGYHI